MEKEENQGKIEGRMLRVQRSTCKFLMLIPSGTRKGKTVS